MTLKLSKKEVTKIRKCQKRDSNNGKKNSHEIRKNPAASTIGAGKNETTWNDECRMLIDEWWIRLGLRPSGFAFSCNPTGRATTPKDAAASRGRKKDDGKLRR